MFKSIRVLLSVRRLTKENTRLYDRVDTLERQLKEAQLKPSFTEVAKDFRIDHLPSRLQQEVNKELSTMLSKDTLVLLQRIQGARDAVSGPAMAAVGYIPEARQYKVRVSLPALHTELKVRSDVVGRAHSEVPRRWGAP